MTRPTGLLRRAVQTPVLWARFYGQRLNPRISYADDSEDLAAAVLLGGVRRFIDIGANDGITCSNTALAALRGAWGWCFEPNPADYLRLRGFYRWASRIECIPLGLSDRDGLAELKCDGLLSAISATEDLGLSQLLAAHQQADAPVVTIPVERLSHWLDRHPETRDCDLLSLDVEGHELSVLHGIDWARHPKPARLLIVETHADARQRRWRHRDFDAIANLLANHGYEKLAASRNNTFWLHLEDRVVMRVAAAKKQFPNYSWFHDES